MSDGPYRVGSIQQLTSSSALQTGMSGADTKKLRAALAAKDAEIERLGSELRAAQDRYAVCCDKRSRLREALSNAAHALDVVRSAISTGQIVDKDALGTAKMGRDAARKALEGEMTAPECRKCCVEMEPGQALLQTFVGGMLDFPGDPGPVTLSAGGPGKLVSCWKCPKCGRSVSQ